MELLAKLFGRKSALRCAQEELDVARVHLLQAEAAAEYYGHHVNMLSARIARLADVVAGNDTRHGVAPARGATPRHYDELPGGMREVAS